MTDRRLVSKAEYARHRGVSGAAVSYWSRDGKIVVTDGKVDVEASDTMLAKTLHPIHGGKREPSNGRTAESRLSPAGINLVGSKTRQATVTAELLELRLSKERGEVHSSARCAQAIAAALAGPLSRLRSIGARTAPTLAAETNVKRIQDIVDDEVEAALGDAATALRALMRNAPSNGAPKEA
jgi:hypothetical protein